MTPASGHSRAQITITDSNNSRTSLIGSELSNKPIGIRIFGTCFQFSSQGYKRTYHKALVLLMTFIAYAAFHMGRRPISIAKPVLHGDCTNIPDNDQDEINLDQQENKNCGWAPFDSSNNELLAYLDTAFLTAYAFFMFSSGILAERMNLRYFITSGSIISGLSLIAFGLARPRGIHSLAYFIVIQIVSGAAQSTAWPVVVTCVGNWFESSKRGLIYGIWNSHTSLGNILGATIAGYFVVGDWSLSFIVPGAIMIVVGIILFLFLVPTPQDVDMKPISVDPDPNLKNAQSVTTISGYTGDSYDGQQSEQRTISVNQGSNGKAVSFMTAFEIPGVFEYSMCLFFSKLVSYTFLYWLPAYLADSGAMARNPEQAAYISNLFDVGGIAGAILAGLFSDKFKASGLTCMAMLLLAIPSMFTYEKFGGSSNILNILLLIIVGALVNGPYCLITTAVSADLGNRVIDGRAMATVSAIIDGMGSLGAVLGPTFAGLVSESGNYQRVFNMLMLADVFASLCLVRVTFQEIKQKLRTGTLEVSAPIV